MRPGWRQGRIQQEVSSHTDLDGQCDPGSPGENVVAISFDLVQDPFVQRGGGANASGGAAGQVMDPVRRLTIKISGAGDLEAHELGPFRGRLPGPGISTEAAQVLGRYVHPAAVQVLGY